MFDVVRTEHGHHHLAAALSSARYAPLHKSQADQPLNYFELHIGDYQRKTAHLTLAEHGAYSLMLQTFYATERPLPKDRKVLYRLLRADSAAERKAVDVVATEFWPEGPTGLVNKRAQEVLDAYHAWVEKQRSNGSRGGRPPQTNGKANGYNSDNPRETQGLTQTKANGGDRARVPLPTSHLEHDQDPTPTPPKGGAVSRRRSPERAEKDEAKVRWRALLSSGGADRDARVQAAIDKIGGWSRIQHRTERDEPRILSEFCDAYREARPA
jgi:uncharacterized protein YdaU (DUF1376 family)